MLINLNPSNTEVINVDCDYKAGNFGDYISVPYCYIIGNVKVHNNNSEILISNPQQNVEAVLINQKETFFIPNGINNFYPNLRLLIVVLSSLKKIFLKNFENFPDLEYLNLNYNQIEMLEENLFKFNHKLKFILISDNKIKLIDPSAFNGLINLKHLNLDDNLKFNATATGQSAIKVLIRSIVDQFWIEVMEVVKLTVLDVDILMTDEQVYVLSKIKKKFDGQFSTANHENNQNFVQKYLIFVLIIVSLLIYSCNFLILYCLYPSK
ncbi:hypothetical protein ACKWTF_014151 [Chironomus riparius]